MTQDLDSLDLSEAPPPAETGASDPEAAVGSFREFITHPLTSIALLLFAVAILAAPFYVRAVERQLIDNELWISICGAFGR